MHIPHDVSFTIGFFVTFFYGFILKAPRAGLIIAIIIALAKEIEDTSRYGEFSWVTTVSLISGAAIAYMFLNIIALL